MLTAPNAVDIDCPTWESPTPTTSEDVAFDADDDRTLTSSTQFPRLLDGPAVHKTPHLAPRTRARLWVRRADLVIVIAMLCGVHVRAVLATLPASLDALSRVTLHLGHALLLFACAYLWVRTYELLGLYAEPGLPRLRDEIPRLAFATTIGVAATVVAHRWVTDALAYQRHAILASTIILWVAVMMLTLCVRGVKWGVANAPMNRRTRHVIIVGSGPRAVSHYHALMGDRGQYNVAGFVDVARQPALSEIDVALIGRLHELEDVIARSIVDEVHIALPVRSCYREFQRTIRVCERLGVCTVFSTDAFEYRAAPPKYQHVAGRPFAKLTPIVYDAQLPLKRIIDVVTAATALLILSPVFILLVILVRMSGPGPIMFTQERCGQHKRRFKLYKFRSMRIDAEDVLHRDQNLLEMYRQNHFKIPEDRDPRLTRIGRFLRKSSLDELPQLWNVLRGDMSLIGPRPIVPAELEHYGPLGSLLLALKPGLAGAWVVQGRSTVGYPKRAEIELSYIREWNLLQDVKIFFRTIPAVLSGRGAH